MFSNTGDAHFNTNTDPYFYRQVPGDDVSAEAMALWTQKSGYKTVAMVFENGGGAKPVTDPLATTLEKLGVNIAENITIAPDETSYRTEVQSVLNAEPELILTETDPQTATTFFSELLELNNGNMIPILGTTATTDPEYPETLGKAIGEKNLEENFEAVTIAAPKPGPALTEFQKYLKAASSTVPEAESFATEPYTTRGYDSIIVAALAMNAAKSASPEKFQPYITKITGEPKGRDEVHTYAEGLAALKKNEEMVYVGTSGPVLWNSNHNLEGSYQVLGYDPASHSYPPVATISAAELAKVNAE
jgi:branched-chain amino acid transport system substrate-binding protein